MQQMNQTPQGRLPSLKNNLNLISNLINSGGNPTSLIQSLLKSNPQLQSLISAMNNSNMTPKQFFYNYAQQNGIDPDQFLNS